MNKTLIVVIVLSAVLAASLVYGFFILQDKNSLTTELRSVQNELNSIQVELSATSAELDTTQQSLASTQSELDSTKRSLVSTQLDLESTDEKLSSTQSELDSTKKDLKQVERELETTAKDLERAESAAEEFDQQLSVLEQQLANAEATLKGLGITLERSIANFDAVMVDNATAQNPTFKEMKDFLNLDKTERNKYIKDEYDCSQFSRDVHNNAEAMGIRSAVVHVSFQ